MKKIILTGALLAVVAVFAACDCKSKSDYPKWAWIGFERPLDQPIILPNAESRFYCPITEDTIPWENGDTFNPAATIKDGKIVVLYRAEDMSGMGIGSRTSRLGCATTTDGLNYERGSVPVFYPAKDSQEANEWPGGCEDPRVAITEDGMYVMHYTQWNRQVPRLAVATSRDLVTWEKHGPAFEDAYEGKFKDIPSKAAAIITKMDGDRQVIAKIDGKYWMYWGEKFVNLAWSDNLADWTPMVDDNGDLVRIMEPRTGYFDSDLSECGPPAIMTEDGIILFYNGKNSVGAKGDTAYTANAYCAGQVLFDKNDMTKILDRLDKPFFKPELDYEKSGQYPAGTVFIEGLVPYNGKWYLYYGCADSRVGVAVYDPAKKEA
jgi:predicted GH43/DUF377 family glycosyl hydrolase